MVATADICPITSGQKPAAAYIAPTTYMSYDTWHAFAGASVICLHPVATAVVLLHEARS